MYTNSVIKLNSLYLTDKCLKRRTRHFKNTQNSQTKQPWKVCIPFKQQTRLLLDKILIKKSKKVKNINKLYWNKYGDTKRARSEPAVKVKKHSGAILPSRIIPYETDTVSMWETCDRIHVITWTTLSPPILQQIDILDFHRPLYSRLATRRFSVRWANQNAAFDKPETIIVKIFTTLCQVCNKVASQFYCW